MNNVAPSYRILALILAALALGLSGAVKAEQDFEYAKLLMARGDFSTDDLIERFIVQLDQNAASKMDSKLIKATFKRRQAEKASLEKRTVLLEDAERLYHEILGGDPKYKYFSMAQKEAESITAQKAMTMIKTAHELDKSNPAKARTLRADAVTTIDKVASRYKTDADEAYPTFKDLYTKMEKWRTDNDKKAEGKQPPKEILDPLNKAFDKWILADQHYVLSRIEQLECYEEGDKARKTLVDELGKLCQTRLDDPVLIDFPIITLRYGYMRGRAYATVQDEANATDSWNSVLKEVDMNEMDEQQKKQVLAIQKQIVHDLVKMKMRLKKYSDVEAIITDMRTGNLRTIFDEDAGKDLMLDYAKALTLPAETASEYEHAVDALGKLIEKEQKGVSTLWANDFARAIAEVLEDARNKGLKPKLAADQWYDAAHGFFVMGQNEHRIYTEMVKDSPTKIAEQKAQFEKAYSNFQNAVDYYRRAITEARLEKSGLLTRLSIEPKSWFEMGLSYLKMQHYYEAIVAYQAMRDTYMTDRRGTWLPDSTGPKAKPDLRKMAKPIQDFLAELDKSEKPKDGLLYKSGANIMFALDQNAFIHKNPEDHWNNALKGRVLRTGMGDILAGEKDITDPDYLGAKTDLENGRSFQKAAKIEADPKRAEENFTQAADLLVKAADKFAQVKTSSKAYEFALFQAGSAYTMAQALWATGKLSSKPREQRLAQSLDLSKKALESYQKYDEYTAKIPATADDDKARRESVIGSLLLARSALYQGTQEWEKVIKTSDEYIAWEGAQSPPPKDSAIEIALINKFSALIELVAASLPPKCDQYLVDAESTVRQWRKRKPNDNSSYVSMLDALSYRNNMAFFQAQKMLKEQVAGITPEAMDGYENKVAEFQAERIDLAESAGTQPSLEDYSRLLYLFMKTHRERKAADVAFKLLEKFDPEDKSTRIPDDEKVWQECLKQINYKVINYADLTKDKRCKADHTTLIDYMYDTREGVANAEHPEKRPDFDKVNVDMNKAHAQIETIKKNYPDCPTLPDPKTGKPYVDPQTGKAFAAQAVADWVDTFKDKYPKLQDLKAKPGATGKAFLEIIEDEIDFRQKIETTRKLLSSVGMDMAEKLDKAGQQDDAKKYRDMAIKQIELMVRDGNDKPELMILLAKSYMVQGQMDQAMKTLNDAKPKMDDGSTDYFVASKMISQIFAAKKNWRDAVDYPSFSARTRGFDHALVKEKWPDMKEFLKDCYEHAEAEAKEKNKASDLPMPDDIKKLIEGKAPESKTEDKPGEKTEAPKPEVKAPASAPEVKAPDAKAPENPPEKKNP